MKRLGKRSQEEIVGFVLIVLVVAVVFLVFLSISLRQDSGSLTESREVYQFLESSMEFSTECGFSSRNYALGELIEKCYEGIKCFDDRGACEVLNETLRNLLGKSWNVGPGSAVKGYEFSSRYALEQAGELTEIISIKAGNCTGAVVRGASYLAPAIPGRIKSELIVCS
jgi:hypothetical protein